MSSHAQEPTWLSEGLSVFMWIVRHQEILQMSESFIEFCMSTLRAHPNGVVVATNANPSKAAGHSPDALNAAHSFIGTMRSRAATGAHPYWLHSMFETPAVFQKWVQDAAGREKALVEQELHWVSELWHLRAQNAQNELMKKLSPTTTTSRP